MSTQSAVFSSDTIVNLGSLSAGNVVGDVTAAVAGASGGLGGTQPDGNPGASGASAIVATVPQTLFPILLHIGHTPNPPGQGGEGGNGFSGGGAGGFQGGITGYSEVAPGNWQTNGQTISTPDPGYSCNPLYGNGGGGSTAIVCGVAPNQGTLLIEAGGSDGGQVTENFVFDETNFEWSFGGGGGGGYSGDAGGNGVSTAIDLGNPGAGGGSQGGAGGICVASGSLGGTGVGGQSPAYGTDAPSGSLNTTVDGGAGGGSGGVKIAGNTASSYCSSLLTSYTFGQQPPGGGNNGSVQLTWTQADAPLAPVLVSPNNGSTFDVQHFGAYFTGTYEANTGQGYDTGNLSAVALGFQQNDAPGVTLWWTGSGYSSTQTWLIPTTMPGQGAPGTEFNVLVPAGFLPNNPSGYFTWFFVCQESLQNQIGPESTPFTFTGCNAPTGIVNSPVGVVNTVDPTLQWDFVFFSGSQVAYEYYIFNNAVYQPGSSSDWFAGFIVSSGGAQFSTDNAVTFSGPFLSGNTYYGYLQVTGTGGNYSDWVEFVFTVELIGGSTPTLSVISTTEPVTGMPAPYLVMDYADSSLGFPLYSEFQAIYNYSGGGVGEFADILGGNSVYGSSTQSACYDMGAPFNVPIAYQGRTFYQTGGQIYFSDWSNQAQITGIPSLFWWIVPPTSLGSSILLHRLASSSAGSTTDTTFSPTTPAMPGNLTASIIIDDVEQLGVFRPFGKATAILVHGDIWGDEFDLDLYFESSQAWTAFRTIRNMQTAVLLKSDMEGSLYWVTIGGDLAPGIASRADRQVNPTRGLTVHCTPTDPYVP